MMLATTPITIEGRFFIRDGTRFNIRGVVYQPLRTARKVATNEDFDPLADRHLHELRKDIVLFKELGINAIKVYRFLPSLSHDAAFGALAEAGIYVLIGLSNPYQCINRMRPYESYTTELVNSYVQTIDGLAKYDNILGVVASDVLINNAQSTEAAPVIRAVVRDIKRHMNRQYELKGQRILPVGIGDEKYASSSTDSIDYFTAGDKNEQIDFYSFTKYDRVEDSATYWDEVMQCFAVRHIPIFVSEYGCNVSRPREWQETPALFSPGVSRVLSGGFAYDFIEGANHYGLVTANGQKLPDFDNLKERLRDLPTVEDLSADDAEIVSGIEESGFPPVSEAWRASSDIPASLLSVT